MGKGREECIMDMTRRNFLAGAAAAGTLAVAAENLVVEAQRAQA